jgi:hypothetical protein
MPPAEIPSTVDARTPTKLFIGAATPASLHGQILSRRRPEAGGIAVINGPPYSRIFLEKFARKFGTFSKATAWFSASSENPVFQLFQSSPPRLTTLRDILLNQKQREIFCLTEKPDGERLCKEFTHSR